jgi:hypothetical protein
MTEAMFPQKQSASLHERQKLTQQQEDRWGSRLPSHRVSATKAEIPNIEVNKHLKYCISKYKTCVQR